jgi:hypothetical protein
MKEMSMKPAVIYIRETGQASLEELLQECRDYADANALEPTAAVFDLRTMNLAYRLGLRGALDMVAAGDMQALIALDPANLSMDPARLKSIREMLRERNCTLHYVRGGS